MTKATHPTLDVSVETYDMLQQIKKIFVSYTGEDIDSFSDDKIIEILASGFLGSEDDGTEGCGEGCGCHHDHDTDHHDDKKKGCSGHCAC